MRNRKLHRGTSLPYLAGLILSVAVAAALLSCGGSNQVQVSFNPSSLTGRITTSLSDPPTCRAPAGDFNHVWVTITRVRAHLSGGAAESEAGWVDLVDLTSNPMQLDLLSTSATGCVLATLGSTMSLPAGRYQQIRLILLVNSPPAGTATPSPNHCAPVDGFNCLELADGTRKILLLSSQANTGIKIPPGQIAGGGLELEAGQAADINIDFNTCSSLVLQGNGDYRLKPTLHAGEVSVTTEVISGRAVDATTGMPIPNGSIIVFAEQRDPGDATIDRVIQQTLADSNLGTFSLCPLPPGNYDIVVAAIRGSGPSVTTYNATITFNVPVGTNLGDLPLVPEVNTMPAQMDGTVTTATASMTATGAVIELAAFEEATPSGGAAVRVTIPTFENSTPNIITEAGMSCPAGTACANYTLFVPASNPQVGTFSSGGTTYTAPAAPPVNYRVNARAFVPDTTDANCSPASQTTDTVTVTGGMSVMAPTLAFTGCQAGF